MVERYRWLGTGEGAGGTWPYVHFICLPPCLPGSPNLTSACVFHEVEMMSYPLFEHQPYTLALATKMATVAETENLDLLHVHYAIPHSISAILAANHSSQAAPPSYTTLHGTDITLVGADRSYLPIRATGLFQSARRYAISHYLKEATNEFSVLTISRSSQLTARLTMPATRLKSYGRHWLLRGEPLLVHVSNFSSVKRPVDCVEIYRATAEGNQHAAGSFGDGSERTNVEHRARCLNVYDKCVFVGKQQR